MTRKIDKFDIFFLIALLIGFVFHMSMAAYLYFFNDETFYYTIPWRLINGDSLVQHEWHLSQFSSIFSYLPVRILTMIQGSMDGIIVFIRCVYILIHTVLSVVVYRFFKGYGIWAVVASMMFYTQAPYATYAISYHSMFAAFILLFAFCLITAVKKNCVKICVGAGCCFGACCVCNPLFSIVFGVYIILCVLWKFKETLLKNISEILARNDNKKVFDIIKFDYTQSYDSLLSGKAFFFSLIGVCIIAIICLLFFFYTGGTLSSFVENFDNLLKSTEYTLFDESAFEKIHRFFYAWSNISFNTSIILPFFFSILAYDKNRTQILHRVIYTVIAFLLSCVYAYGILKTNISDEAFIFSLPFAIFSIVCYFLTKNKNKILFYCMWCVCIVGAVIHGVSANTLMTASGVLVCVANIAGVLFVRDLFCEIKTDLQPQNNKEKVFTTIVRVVVCVGLFLQIIFNGVPIYSFRYIEKDVIREKEGPFAGMLLSESHHSGYIQALENLDKIEERSEEDAPILIISPENWMYLHLNRPFGTYSAWDQIRIDEESLRNFYSRNNDRLPQYVYVHTKEVIKDVEIRDNYEEEILRDLADIFSFTKEYLPDGILLTVTDYKFDNVNENK